MSLDSLHAALRRRLWRREVLPLLPALLLALYWGFGEAALIGAAAVFPAAWLLLMPGASAQVRVTDGLTGLPLKADLVGLLDAAFAELPRTGRGAAVFAVGIDDFDEIAARHGLHLAEEVERRTGARLAGLVRRGDLTARLDAGRYAVAFGPSGRADLETALQVAERIQSAVGHPS